MDIGIFYWDVDPVIFWITEGFPFKYYGIFFAIGIVVGYMTVVKIYKKEKVPQTRLETLSTYIVLGTILGARLGHCFFYDPSYYLLHPLEILLPIRQVGDSFQFIGFQGLASHGGAIGVLSAIAFYCKKYDTNYLWQLDRVAIAVPLTGAFIRMGNFMNSEIIGVPTANAWGVVFSRVDSMPRHPAQLYEGLAYLIIFAVMLILYWVYDRSKHRGYLFGTFLVLTFLSRFILEFFKENQVGFEANMTLNMGQLLSLPFILLGSIFIYLSIVQGKRMDVSSHKERQVQ